MALECDLMCVAFLLLLVITTCLTGQLSNINIIKMTLDYEFRVMSE